MLKCSGRGWQQVGVSLYLGAHILLGAAITVAHWIEIGFIF